MVKKIGIIQIVIALIMTFVAFRLDFGAVEWSKQLRDTCREFSRATEMHKETYTKSIENLLPLRDALMDMGNKTDYISAKVISFGNAWQSQKGKWYWPKAAVDLGKSIHESGNDVKALANALKQQSGVLEYYRTETYPKTISSFDSAITSLNTGAKAMDNVYDGLHCIKILFLFIGFFFLLNGVALLKIAKIKSGE